MPPSVVGQHGREGAVGPCFSSLSFLKLKLALMCRNNDSVMGNSCFLVSKCDRRGVAVGISSGGLGEDRFPLRLL